MLPIAQTIKLCGFTWFKSLTQEITDFILFYQIECLVLQQPNAQNIRNAYLSYYASESASNKDEEGLKERLVMLMKDALILAKVVRGTIFSFVS